MRVNYRVIVFVIVFGVLYVFRVWVVYIEDGGGGNRSIVMSLRLNRDLE